MHPLLTKEIADLHFHDLERRAEAGRLARLGRRHGALADRAERAHDGGILIRPARRRDVEGVAELAGLDSKHAPSAPMLVAEVDCRLLAAIGIADGEAVADPFRPTGDIVALLRLRAAQMRESEDERGVGRGLAASRPARRLVQLAALTTSRQA